MTNKIDRLNQIRELEALVNVYKDQPDNLVNKLWSWRNRSVKQREEEMVEKCIQEVKEIEIRTDDGGDYISEDVELMRTETIETLKELLP